MKELDFIPYKYENGIRYILIDNNWVPEDNQVFVSRMKEAEDVQWQDIARAESELPVFDDCKKDRRDLRSALEGIAAGGKMLVVTSKAGFPSWNDFECYGLSRCKAVRQLYYKAKAERVQRRLNDAEDSLYERGVEGVDEPIINHLGQIVGYKKKYSDRLLELQLKSLDPDKYGDKKDVNVKGLVINVDMGLRDNDQEKIINDEIFTGLDVLHNQDVTEDNEDEEDFSS